MILWEVIQIMRKRIYARHHWPFKIKYRELLLVKRLEKDYDDSIATIYYVALYPLERDIASIYIYYDKDDPSNQYAFEIDRDYKLNWLTDDKIKKDRIYDGYRSMQDLVQSIYYYINKERYNQLVKEQ